VRETFPWGFPVVNRPGQKILIVDDDVEFVNSLSKILTKSGYTVNSAQSCAEACKLLNKEIYPLVLLDLHLPDSSGLDFLKTIKGRSPQTNVIMITVNGDIYNYDKAMQRGAFAYLNKPVKKDKILSYTNKALRQFNSQFVN